MKKVILFLVDSLHPVVLKRTLSEGKAPAFSFLAKHGIYIDNLVSTFPTMTPVATSSIITGSMPDIHRVPGFIWYNEEIRKIVDYGATVHGVLKMGTERVFRNILIRLNEEHLNPNLPTLYEELEASGYSTGNVNFFIHRAKHFFQAKIPLFISLATRFHFEKAQLAGPSHLTIGQLIHPAFSGRANKYPRGIFNRFGVNDVFSGRVAAQLVREGKQPDFMVVYFPDNDKYSHHNGPLRSGPTIERADKLVAAVLDEFGSWEKALEENAIIITGDHAQSTVGLGEEYLINLDRELKSFKCLKLTEEASIENNQEIVICPNERMAFIYFLQRRREILPEIVGILAQDPRNTQIAWKVSENRFCALQGGTEKQLFFAKMGPYQDRYGQSWSIEGDLSVVDARIVDESFIEFGKFPDALARLMSAIEARSESPLVLSAASGYEYLAEGGPIHPGGGSHGSLEEEDSTIPLIVTGMPLGTQHPRIIDLYPMILNHFGLGHKQSS